MGTLQIYHHLNPKEINKTEEITRIHKEQGTKEHIDTQTIKANRVVDNSTKASNTITKGKTNTKTKAKLETQLRAC